MSKRAIAWVLFCSFGLAAGAAVAQNTAPIYGSQMMTQQERDEYRSRMRNAQSDQERQKLRQEHHDRMKERAKQRGLSLSDEPPVRGGIGSGTGPGAEMGPGPGGPRGR